jgi:GDP-L-fucose synthase
MKRIFITGHKGMVGSAILRNISKKNKIFTIDKKKLDLLDFNKTYQFFKKNKFDEIYLCAARVGGIYANSTYPADFIYQNLQIQNNCIFSAFKTKVKKLLFLGSSCIYPKETKIPIKENYLMTGKLEKTNEAYAIAKISGIKMCESFNNQYNTDFRSVMPANLYGVNDNYDELNSHVLAALVRKILIAKKNNKKVVTIWGNGKAKREFLHTDDFAKACIKVMSISKKKYHKICGAENQFINIGFGKEITIKDLALTISQVIDFKGKFYYDKTKPNGTFRKLTDSSKIKSLNWSPKISLKDGLKKIIYSK